MANTPNDDGTAVGELVDNLMELAAKKEVRTGGGADDHDKPVIQRCGGDLPAIIDDAEQALLRKDTADLYQRGGQLVRPVVEEMPGADRTIVRSWRLLPVTRPYLVECLTAAARFQIYRRREKEWVDVDCPDNIAECYLAREGSWRLPPLVGVINAPALRADGSLLDQPGYDFRTGLLFEPDGAKFPGLPPDPSKRDAEKALALLENLIATFPFVGPVDRAVAVSGIISAIDRRAVPTVPLHAYSAPVAGSGKTMLVDACSAIATGRPAPVIDQSRSDEETEKRLVAALLRGGSVFSIDNCERPLDSSLLCQALTAVGLMQLRVLGASREVDVPASAMIYATGNNLMLAGDLTRRAVICRLDPACERPELREFDCAPLDVIGARRGDYVVAALTVIQAYLKSGERVSVTPIGSFDGWSRRVREALIWLDRADPCESMTALRSADHTLANLQAVTKAWQTHVGEQPMSARGIVDIALRADPDGRLSCQDLHDSLMVVAGHGREIDPKRLGTWLRRVADRVADGRRIVSTGLYAGTQRWKVAHA
jgi:putative DNA primase/helicase